MRLLRPAAALLGAALLGSCDPGAPPATTPVDEPTSALRPSDRSGSMPRDAHVVDYQLDARLDEETRQISGRATISWRNPTTHVATRLPLHLYMNGFRAEDTRWMRQGRGSHRGEAQGKEHPWGYIDITSLQQVGGAKLEGAERDDPSVYDVALPSPIAPGESIEIEIEFVTQLPRVFARTGFAGDFYMVGQWFPKVAVLDPDGTWADFDFTFHSEFYADFGNYEVRLDVPRRMKVGASGIRVDESVEGERRLLHFKAEMVHDFAWTAFGEYTLSYGEYEGIRIQQFLSPDAADDSAFHLDAQVAALKSMEKRFGPYPWSTITIVHPPPYAGGAMGMEYPTLYTTDLKRPILPPLRALMIDERLSGVGTTIHEFGHQYFQGLFASNENAQPWLDEGMNTFSNVLVYYDWYGHDPWVMRVAGHDLTVVDLMRLVSRRVATIAAPDQGADDFSPLTRNYSPVVYRRTACVMLTLRELAGPERFDAAMRSYGDRFRFRHPKGSDLEATLLEGIGSKVTVAEGVDLDVALFLEQGLRSPKQIDFAVFRADNVRAAGIAGFHRDEEGSLADGGEVDRPPVRALPDDQVEGIAVIHRVGEFIVPVEIEVAFSDGTTEYLAWDGTGRFRVLRFPGRRVRRVAIDPHDKLVLEAVRHDNGRFAPEEPAPPGPHDHLGDVAEAAALAVTLAVGP